MASSKNSILLDVDPTIIESNLLLKDPECGPGTLFPPNAGPQSKVTTPIPGMCIKVRRSTDDHGKVFINLCHTMDIPAPEDITEARLVELWDSKTETCNYKVPLSIGARREEPDKSGRPAEVYDVAINTTFYGKVESSKLFRMFISDLIIEAVEVKFNIELDNTDYVLLKNRKAMGTIPGHRVRIGDRPTTTGESKPAMPLIQELSTSYLESSSRTSATATAAARAVAPSTAVKPDFRLLKEPASGPARALVAQFQLPSVVSAREVTVDVGEDRLILNSDAHEVRKPNYHLDMFLPHHVIQTFTTASFDKSSKILTVTMPVVQAA